MKKIEKYPLKDRFVALSKSASILVVAIGILICIGWVFDIPWLKSVLLSFQTTKINTAIVFILSGAVLLGVDAKKYQNIFYLRRLASLFILLIGILTLSQYVFNINLGIDEFFIRVSQTASDSFTGRMSFASSVCTILIGIALIWLDHPKEKIRDLSQYPAVIVITISFLAIIGYVYDVQALYRLDTYSTMGVHTAFGFMLCALSVLWARPDEGWTKIITAESAGGFVLRRLLIPILVIPLILGWLILLGAKTGWYETYFGLAIISVLITGFLIVTLLVNGEQLNRIDQNRKQAEERYRNVLDNLMEGAQIIGFDWRYLYVNDAVAKQGYQTKENLLGRTMMEAYPGIENTEFFAILTSCMEERIPHAMENEFTYPNGKKGWFELSIQPVSEGLFILSNNITERKHAEERFYLAVDSAPNAIIITDANGNIIIVNSQAEVYFQYTRQELLSLQIEMLIPERFRAGHVNHRKGFLSKPYIRDMGVDLDLYGFRKDGSEFPVEIGLTPIESHGEMLVMATIVDITERKQNEEALLKLNAELELRIFERTAHLNLTNEKLQNELLKRGQAEGIILQQNKMLSELHEITLDLLKQNSLERLLKRIVEISAKFLDAPYVSIALFDTDKLVVKATTQNQSKMLGQRLGRKDAKLSWQAFDSRKTVVLQDYSTWVYRRKEHEDLPHYAVADFPILNGDECLGILGFGRDKPNYEFSKEQIQIGNLFASMATLVLNNAQLRETLREQSIHDSLTGLFNRRYMEETLKQEMSRAIRNDHSLGIIMIDIDHFKNFNDSFGHLAGDSLLSQLGQFLQTNIRVEDTACRYGGEEFFLIMPNSQLEIIQQRAEFLREGAMKLQVFDNQKTFTGITISAGIAMYPQHGTNIEDLIRSADNALYQAKQNGRNQVRVAM
ncbi:MAG TPA: hypothetical protein DHW49_06665 [Anaerolineae bacterium]|nr:hypothetical protein [Anaerolineae bacterium]